MVAGQVKVFHGPFGVFVTTGAFPEYDFCPCW
jgi:hypothetical protein